MKTTTHILGIAVLVSGCYGGVALDDESALGAGTDGVSSDADGHSSAGEGDAEGGSGGDVGSMSGGDDVDGGEEGTIPDLPASCEAATIGCTPPRLLTQNQLRNMLHDSFPTLDFGADELIASLPEDSQYAGFANNVSAQVSSLHIGKYLSLFDSLANAAVDNIDTLGLDCNLDRACAELFVATYGRRVYRRPLEPAEIEEMLVALYDPEPTFDAGFRQVVRGMMLRPEALYQFETTDDPTVVAAVSAPELATKLSLFLWDTVPDEELLAAADDGSLMNDDGLQTQVRRMLADPRASQTIARFYHEWLRLDEGYALDPDEVDGLSEGTFAAAIEAFDLFTTEVARSPEGTYTDLLMSNVAYVNEELAALYGVPFEGEAVPDKPGWLRVELDPSTRGGMLTRVAFLAATSHGHRTSPTLRGREIRNQVLCQNVPDPPPDVMDLFPQLPDDDTKTTRQIVEDVTSAEPRCAGCHQLMDPLGFTFENYASSGAWRAEEHGLTIDTSVTDAQLGPMNDALDLSAILTSHEGAQACFVDNWMNYALMREVGSNDAQPDYCATQAARDAFAQTDGNITEMLVEITLSPAFRFKGTQF